jgi:hypothetical protein
MTFFRNGNGVKFQQPKDNDSKKDDCEKDTIEIKGSKDKKYHGKSGNSACPKITHFPEFYLQ